jgi:hypothetical protein
MLYSGSPQDHSIVDLLRLREAIEVCWDNHTSYMGVAQPGNPAYGQCYPTSFVVQHYFPNTEILEGVVLAGSTEHTHFWNGLYVGDTWYHIDLTWQQFPVVKRFTAFDRESSANAKIKSRRFALLLMRVEEILSLKKENGHV